MGKKQSNPPPPAYRSLGGSLWRRPPPPAPPEVGDGHNHLSPLAAVCTELLPHAIAWKHTLAIALTVVNDLRDDDIDQVTEDEIAALQKFIDVCQTLGLHDH